MEAIHQPLRRWSCSFRAQPTIGFNEQLMKVHARLLVYGMNRNRSMLILNSEHGLDVQIRMEATKVADEQSS